MHASAALSLLALVALVQSAVVPSSCSQAGSCSNAIQSALTACAAGGDCTIQFDNEHQYVIDGPDEQSCLFEGSGNVQLVGNGAQFILKPLSGFLCLSNGNNVRISNLSIDMARLPFSYGRVVASSASESTVEVDSTQYPQATPTGLDWTSFVQAVLQYDPVAGHPAVHGQDIYRLPPTQLNASWAPGPNASFAQVTVQGVELTLGSWQILRHQVYSLNGLSFTSVGGLTVEDVTLWSVPGMGVLCDECTGVTLRRFQVRKREGRPMSITADGIHLTSSRGGDILLDSCLLEGQGDDGTNIPSRYWEIRQTSNDRKTLQLWQRGAQIPFAAQPGDELMFYNRAKFYAYGTGESIRVQSVDGNAGTMTMTAPLPPQGLVWDLVLNLANQPRSITLVNTTYRANRARGALLKASDVAVINCTFDHTSGPAIRVVPDGAMWFEGDVVSRGNWTMSDSRVVGCNYGAAANPGDVVFAATGPVWVGGKPTTRALVVQTGVQHYNITIARNQFEQDQGQAVLEAYGIQGAVIEDNDITASPAPAVNLMLSSSMVGTRVSGNVCNGGACKSGPPPP